MQFYGKRKITLNYSMFIKNGSCQCLQINTFMGEFSSVYCSILSKMVQIVHFWMTFCKNSIRISCQIIFVNKHWPQSCLCPFNRSFVIICASLVNSFVFRASQGVLGTSCILFSNENRKSVFQYLVLLSICYHAYLAKELQNVQSKATSFH